MIEEVVTADDGDVDFNDCLHAGFDDDPVQVDGFGVCFSD